MMIDGGRMDVGAGAFDGSTRGAANNVAVLEIQEFETAFPVSSSEKDEVLRRFSTLLVDSSGARRAGANGFVTRAYNVFGEEFAVKRLRAGAEGTPTLDGDDPQATERSLAAFRTEYESQLALANLKGFPRLYGFGMAGAVPLILMEWIEGVSLAELMASKRANVQLDPAFAMRIGAALFDALARLDGLTSRPVHRDLSSSNVMMRTSERSLEEQMAGADLDLCIIDFGSTTVLDGADPRFTTATSIMRHATPEYAPPEMLTDALPDILDLRRSPSIDVYAACSILYELMMGHTPYMLAERPDEVPYLVKTSAHPQELQIEGYEDACRLVMAGLSADQAARPSAQELRNGFLRATGQAVPDALGAGLRLEVLPAHPQGVHLLMPRKDGASHGVKEASFGRQDAVPPSLEDAPFLHITRRGFIAGAIGGVAMLALLGAGALAMFSAADRGGEADGEDAVLDEASSAAKPAYEGGSLYVAQDAETGLWGYVNAQRAWVIKPIYPELPGLFSEGLARVKDEESGLYGYIGEDGAWRIEPAFSSANGFGEGRAFAHRVRDGAGEQQRSASRGGWIDQQGDWVIEPAFAGGGIFKGGLCAALEDAGNESRWGYIDQTGAWAISPAFMDAGPFAENGLALAAAHVGQYGWIAQDGSWAIEPAYGKAGSFSEGLAPFADPWSEFWGYLDEAGVVAIEPQFSSARLFKAGLASCEEADSGLWGFIDETGEWRISPRFERAGDFLHGLAAAQDSESHLFGYIDDTGCWVIPPQYASVNLSLLE